MQQSTVDSPGRQVKAPAAEQPDASTLHATTTPRAMWEVKLSIPGRLNSVGLETQGGQRVDVEPGSPHVEACSYSGNGIRPPVAAKQTGDHCMLPLSTLLPEDSVMLSESDLPLDTECNRCKIVAF